jgi:hypothetical protein
MVESTTMVPHKRNQGRGTQVQVRLDRERLEQLDDWRRTQADIPTRGEAVRRLMDRAFKDG